MQKLTYLFAAAAISGLALMANPGSANPLASGLASGTATVPEISEGLVQKVHGYHCKRKYGWYRGDKYWHRHRRACRYGYRHRHYYGGPVVSFSFGLGHRHRHRHHRMWWWD